MDESKLYPKVMGIEEARKAHIPMPPTVKIPKGARLNSSGGLCTYCGNETLEGHEDGHGMWHYRCTYCIAHQKPSPDPCPRCRCTAHDRISETSESKRNSPFQPDIMAFKCLNCGFIWNTPEYEKYLLTKVVRSVLPTSDFSENRKIE
jgi:hypothetical protein